MEIKDLKKIIRDLEQQSITIPKGKTLISGNKELIERMKLEGWQGDYHYTNLVESDKAYLIDNTHKFNPYHYSLEGMK